MTSSESSANSNSNLEIEQALTEVEQALKDLENRYNQVKKDWKRKSDLIAEKKQLEPKKAQ